ncbi:hypothetical protein JB92DRAFT_2830966 [Gautieria morchelliformis]|nr:hypothetical protein JB92DRAFT_2830966 [Gautieria morchelliformis]
MSRGLSSWYLEVVVRTCAPHYPIFSQTPIVRYVVKLVWTLESQYRYGNCNGVATRQLVLAFAPPPARSLGLRATKNPYHSTYEWDYDNGVKMKNGHQFQKLQSAISSSAPARTFGCFDAYYAMVMTAASAASGSAASASASTCSSSKPSSAKGLNACSASGIIGILQAALLI